MFAKKYYLDNLLLHLKNSVEISKVVSRLWVYKEQTIVLEFQNNSNRYALDLNFEGVVLVASVLGRSDASRRILRNALIGKHEMRKAGGERHILGTIEERPEEAVLSCVQKLRLVQNELDEQAAASVRGASVHNTKINVFWWDKKPNFGDVIGPWMVSQITKKDPVSGRGLALATPPLMTIGSTFSWLDQDGTAIWGSGLMSELSEEVVMRLKSLTGISVCAVRGKLTRAEVVEKLGWDVPAVYGDPALLLPRYLPVEKTAEPKKTVIVPHFSHMKHFKGSESESVRVVDVQDGMESVVRQIATAAVCISTSLHGLIIAQAYGVPWIWVRVADNQLGGDTFKFRDFFSTLDSSAVRSLDVSKEDIGKLDFVSIAKTASLPELQIDLDDLLAAFPHPQEHTSSGTHPGDEESIDDLTTAMAGLVRKVDSIFEELAEQRQLLERLTSHH